MVLIYLIKICFMKKVYIFNQKHYSFVPELSYVLVQLIECMKIKGFTVIRYQVSLVERS